MAEMQPSANTAARGGARSKKLSTRVDLTPMVDLGFLLITFFIFTTTLSQPTTMRMIIPTDNTDNEPPLTAESKTLSLLLGDNDEIGFYVGIDPGKAMKAGYGADGLRTVIRQQQAAMQSKFGDAKETVVLIKPTTRASYRNVVAVLDEMLINQVSRYVLMEPSKEEETVVFSKKL